ncbi:MAG TPA: phosphatase PAP2 family protein [Actinomycetota bacterium]|nr:phosphatase PAP2 family protein [Actinomycetota bacterium]
MSGRSGESSGGEPFDDDVVPVQPPSERLAERLEAGPSAPAPALVRALRELAAVDKAVYRAVAATPTPTLDGPLRTFTSAADHSKLWIGAAAVLFAVGGRKGRRAALTGVAAIACTSAIVNLPMKLAGHRRRPDADAAGVPLARRVEMPTSASFPSGHSASAAAFASSVSQVVPALGLPLGAAAAAVGYSRVHSGVHYPGDVVAGALVGSSVGGLVAWAGRVLAARRRY